MFEGMILSRVTTVASVTEQNNDFPPNFDENSYYELYSIATTSLIPPYTLTIHKLHFLSIASNKTQKLTRTEHSRKRRPPSTKSATKNRIRSLHPHSHHDTLSRSHLHTPQQRQGTKRSGRHVRRISLTADFFPFFVPRPNSDNDDGLHKQSDG